MFKVEIKNLSISANLGITELERKKKQLLKVTLSFDYKVCLLYTSDAADE